MGRSIECIKIYKIELPLKAAFKTSLGEVRLKRHILVEVISEGISGWGEAPTLTDKQYINEDDGTVFEALRSLIIPVALKAPITHPSEVYSFLNEVPGNTMAKAALEMAYWDLYARKNEQPLYKVLGGINRSIKAIGVVGIQDRQATVDKIKAFKKKGVKRVKVKINRETPINFLSFLKEESGEGLLSVDCNGCFTESDISYLQELDKLNLQMIEQPFGASELKLTKKLQSLIKTSICLDESIRSEDDAQRACNDHACSIISVKPTCVGGHEISRKITDVAHQNGCQSYCGGMFETSIGRAHNIALSSLGSFTLENEISDFGVYYEVDTVIERISLGDNGAYDLSDMTGIGVTPNIPVIGNLCVKSEEFR